MNEKTFNKAIALDQEKTDLEKELRFWELGPNAFLKFESKIHPEVLREIKEIGAGYIEQRLEEIEEEFKQL